MHVTGEEGGSSGRRRVSPARGVPGLGAAAVLLLLAACVPARLAEWRRHHEERINNGLTDWSNLSADLMIERYGPPDRVETLRIVWLGRRPWKRIEVWDDLQILDDDRASSNIVDTISYPVPARMRRALAAFSRGLYVSSDGAELSARSSSEERNFLLLNLADEIVKGDLSPANARAVFSRTLALARAGRESASMRRLLFR